MQFPLITSDEEARIRALERLEILDTEPEKPFDTVVSLVRQTLRAPICTVSLIDRERQWFKARSGIEFRETPRSESFCTHAIRQVEPFLVPDARLDPRFADSPLVTAAPFVRSYAGIPLVMADGYVVGSLCVMDVVARTFEPAEIEILKNFAKIVIDEIELRQVASVDPMTGALSRSAWRRAAEAEIQHAEKTGDVVSVALFDLDRFKRVNDEFGHAAGDAVIDRFARICLGGSRDTDLFGRLGGEEFALLMPQTLIDDAAARVEKLRNRMELETFEGPGRVTVSAGVATIGSGGSTLAWLLDVADQALYRAKKRGRNRVIQARETPADERAA